MKMKKALKIIAMLSIVCTLFFVGVQPVFADVDVPDVQVKQTTEMNNLGSTISGYLMGAAIIVTLIVLIYTGLKFIVGSANEKAEYKKSLIPIVVGCLIITFATVIVKILFSVNGN